MQGTKKLNKILWEPRKEALEETMIGKFMAYANKKLGKKWSSYDELYNFSVNSQENFWDLCWEFFNVIGKKGDELLETSPVFHKNKFFPKAELNYAENILKNDSNQEAIVFWREDKKRSALTFSELKDQALRFAKGLEMLGVKEGDRVAAYMPNIPETIVCFLGTAAIGAIWSSCSPDFGVSGILDRFTQIEPKVFITTDGYIYNGKQHSNEEKMQEILKSLPTVQKTIIVPFLDDETEINIPHASHFKDFLKNTNIHNFKFRHFDFHHPLYILFSSGTTGKPKCIVHSAGRALMQHLKEHQLHSDIRSNDRVFYFTTCGWMMWNWLVSALSSEATIILYDGSPFAYKGKILLDLAFEEDVTFFGVSAKYIDALNKTGLKPIETHRFPKLRVIGSTGSPLSPESFDYIYSSFKTDVQLSSLSGGTDIVSCFALGSSINPVYQGELQVRGLGMSVDVFDDNGQSLIDTKGELVCTKPFMAMPVNFWNDPNDEKYLKAYFQKYPNIWHHGDYVEMNSHGGLMIHGRSDATLNPGGVRIGTAEIYRQVEKISEVLECFAIGQEFKDDVRIILFVKLKDHVELTPELINQIKQEIKDNTTPRHVPAKIIAVPDIPKTKSGKIVEIAVRDLIHKLPIHNVEAISNPESLEFYKELVI